MTKNEEIFNNSCLSSNTASDCENEMQTSVCPAADYTAPEFANTTLAASIDRQSAAASYFNHLAGACDTAK